MEIILICNEFVIVMKIEHVIQVFVYSSIWFMLENRSLTIWSLQVYNMVLSH